MPRTIHSNNVILETSHQDVPGWARELCYQTLLRGELDAVTIQSIFDIFKVNGNAKTAEPTVEAEKELRIRELRHIRGVNALSSGTKITFCEEGMTLIYGHNGTGKSGYFRVLEHLAGGSLSGTVLHDIRKQHPDSPLCEIDYELDGAVQPTFTWNNTPATKGGKPFDSITVFDSRYAAALLKKHCYDSYIIESTGLFDYRDLQSNLAMLSEKVNRECPDQKTRLSVPELETLNLNVIYDTYLVALRAQLDIEIKRLLGKNPGVVVEKEIDSGVPNLIVKLDKPYDIEQVLSEGEIKAIALALLLAALELKPKKNPVVFDDPVNSLDNTILRKFADRIVELDNQVILFTHNIWLTKHLLQSNNNVHAYLKHPPRIQRISTNKHLIPFEVVSTGSDKGLVGKYDSFHAKYYLDAAKTALDTNPFTKAETMKATQCLRRAVELLVDEKIFLNLEPCKIRGNHQKIMWTDLMQLKNVTDATIQTLKDQYDILSSDATHVGMTSTEDELDHDDLDEIFNKLIAL